jgi:hypothetical protein
LGASFQINCVGLADNLFAVMDAVSEAWGNLS